MQAVSASAHNTSTPLIQLQAVLQENLHSLHFLNFQQTLLKGRFGFSKSILTQYSHGHVYVEGVLGRCNNSHCPYWLLSSTFLT